MKNLKKRSFLYGALILSISALITKALGAFYRIPLTNMLGAEGMGIYQMIFPVYALFWVLASAGVPVAVSRMIAREEALKNYDKIKKIMKSAVFLMLIVGLLFSLIIFLFSGSIATFQGNSLAELGYKAIAPCVLAASVVSVFRAYFQGKQNMAPSAVSQIVEQLAKVGFGLYLTYIFIGYGLQYGVLGAILGCTISEVVAFFVILGFYLFAKRKNGKVNNPKSIKKDSTPTTQIVKEIVCIAVPVTFSSIIMPLTIVIDSILIINILNGVGFSLSVSTSLFGIQSGVVNSLVNLPVIIATAISVAIIPSISSSFALKNTKQVTNKTFIAIKLIWIIAIPCVVIFFMFAKDIIPILYENGLNSVSFDELGVSITLLKISAINIFYISMVQILTSILQAMGKSFVPARNLFLSSIIKIVLSGLLLNVLYLNIYGAALATGISYSLACFLNLISIRKIVPINFSVKNFLLKPLVSVISMVIVVILFNSLFKMMFSDTIASLISIALSLSVYGLLILFLKVFNKTESKFIPIVDKLVK